MGLLWLTSGGVAARSAAQNDALPAPAPDKEPAFLYQLRVENQAFGRVEMSADGVHFRLVGRVRRPAATVAPERQARLPGALLRANGDEIAFGVAPGFGLRLRPQSPAPASSTGRRGRSFLIASVDKAALTTNLTAGQGVFGDLLPVRAQVKTQFGDLPPVPFPEGFAPGENDAYFLTVTQCKGLTPASEPGPEKRAAIQTDIARRIETWAAEYAARALARAHFEARLITSGTLTLRARMPSGEPDPIRAVMYSIDGDMVAAQNVGPFAYAWDTRQVGDGEHVVEIRALNGRGTLLTRARALVVVQNKANGEVGHPAR